MATSSITKNFVISGEEQVEKFVNAVEESYQDSLNGSIGSDMRITHLKSSTEVKKFMEKRKKANG